MPVPKQAAERRVGNRQNAPGAAPVAASLTRTAIRHPLASVLLFKRILDFQKTEGGVLDKRGAKRYPVGAKFPIKAKITLTARDGEGNAKPGASIDWGGQLGNLSGSGVSIRLHPAAVANSGEACALKLELDNKIFELETTVAHFRVGPQYVACGLAINFPDSYTRKAYLQLMEPVVIGSTLAPATGKVKQDLPGLIKEQYQGESDSLLSVWRDSSGKTAKLFELVAHDYCIRGTTETPGLKITSLGGSNAGKRASRPVTTVPITDDHQAEVRQLFQFIVQNLGKGVPSELKRFLELFAG
jgi:hypothetical protein